jgi:hypothetical protein
MNENHLNPVWWKTASAQGFSFEIGRKRIRLLAKK